MIINSNGSQPRSIPTAKSPPPFTTHPQQQLRHKPIPPFKTFEQYQKTIPIKVQPNTANPNPRPPSSYSLNTILKQNNLKQAGFNKLDTIARNTVTYHKQDAVIEPMISMNSLVLSKPQSMAQSTLAQSNPFNRSFFGSNRNSQQQQIDDDISPAPKKRRQSVDMGLAARSNRQPEVMNFLRRTQQPKDSKQIKMQNPQQKMDQKQSSIQSTQAQSSQSSKQNLFQFLKKKKEIYAAEMSLSMIVAPQSSKSMQMFGNNHLGYRKTDFSGSAAQKCSLGCDKIQQETAVFNSPKKPLNMGNFNFQFKKKKASESAVEQAVSFGGSTVSNSGKQPLSRRRNYIPQREIKLSDFQLLDKLGKGSFGEVFLAQEKAIGFVCVIKKMSKQRIKETKVEQHVLRQIKIQSYLNHGSLTALYGCFQDEDSLYLVLEALPDGSLQQVKKKRKLPEKETAAIVRQVSEGLKYMHEEYVIHRDLKPENLFVNDGVIKIGDFGCSIYNHDLAIRNTVVGCLEYSSPEQLSKEGYTEKIDSWSLGILTYELLFGRSPFESDIIKIARSKEQQKPELSGLVFPAGTPVGADTKSFIENLLSEDPQLRMQMDEVLRHPFLREEIKKKPSQLQQLQG